MEELRSVLGWVLLLPGAAFCVVGGLGLLRMPDTLSRVHGAGIIDTLGAALILFGLVCAAPHWTVMVKLVLILFFLYITSSTATHALAHWVYESNPEIAPREGGAR